MPPKHLRKHHNSGGPKPPRCAEKSDSAPALQLHGDCIPRPFHWLHNIHSDPDVMRHLRHEAHYTFTVQKQKMSTIVNTLLGEMDARDPGTDAAIVDVSGGYYWWSDEGDGEEEKEQRHHQNHQNNHHHGRDIESEALLRKTMLTKNGKTVTLSSSSQSQNHTITAAAAATTTPTTTISDTSRVNALGHVVNNKKKYLRTKITAENANFIDECAQRFSGAGYWTADWKNPAGDNTEMYVDFNVVARRYNLKNMEQVDDDVSPSQNRVCIAVDTTSGSEECSILVFDIASKRQLCVVGPLAQLAAKLESGDNNNNNTNMKKKKKKSSSVHGIVVSQIPSCAANCVFLDEDTVAFIETSTDTRHACRVWALYIGGQDTDDEEQQKRSADRDEQEKEDVNKTDSETIAAATTMPSSSSPSSSATSNSASSRPQLSVNDRLTLLFEERDPRFEICGLYATSSLRHVIISTSHSRAFQSLFISTPRLLLDKKMMAKCEQRSNTEKGNAEQNDDRQLREPTTTATMMRYKATPFRARMNEEQLWLDHDPRPLSFFLGGTKEAASQMIKKKEKKKSAAEHDQLNNDRNYSSSGGTWFITSNIMTSNCEMSVYVCSGDEDTVDHSDTSNWLPFFIAPAQSAPVPCSADDERVDSGDCNNPADAKNRRDNNCYIDHLKQCVVIEDLAVRQHFLTIEARIGGMATILLLDLSSFHSSSSSSSSLPPSLPLKMSDFTDVRTLIPNDSLFAAPCRSVGTHVDCDSVHDWDSEHLFVSVHNPVVPTATFRLEKKGMKTTTADAATAAATIASAQGGAINQKTSINNNKKKIKLAAAETKPSASEVNLAASAASAPACADESKHHRSGADEKSTASAAKNGSWTLTLLLAWQFKDYNPERFGVEMRFAPALRDPESWKKGAPAAASDDDDDAENISSSGTIMIPVLLCYRTDKLKKDGKNACLLETYSSYGDAHDVSFENCRVSLLNRGVIFAVAMCRGSGEFGNDWHEQGTGLRRKCTFHDFIAVAEYLLHGSSSTNKNNNNNHTINKTQNEHRRRESSKLCDRICCRGESAGGTVIGSVINMRPDLFVGAIARVPFVNVLQTMCTDAGAMTHSETQDWGDPKASKMVYDLLKSYSPVENVPPAHVTMPSIWVESNIHDMRVSYTEPAVWVAKLRQRWGGATAAAGRILLHKVNFEGGHDGDLVVDESQAWANEFGFACWTLGITQ